MVNGGGVDMGSLDVIINHDIEDGTFYKMGEKLICASDMAYSFCFINGVDAFSIDMAGKIAMKVLREKLDRKIYN